MLDEKWDDNAERVTLNSKQENFTMSSKAQDGSTPQQESNPCQGLVLGSGLDKLGTGKISNIPFVSAEYFEREKQIWHKSWLAIGRTSDLQKPGDYITFDLKIAHAALLVVVGKDKRLRAFYNICSHRAGRLVCDADAHGSIKFLMCPFHGWMFDLDGSLRSIPKKSLFEKLDEEDLGLREVHVDVWGGFVFVNLAQQPEHSLSQYMEGVPDTLSGYLSDKPWTWYTGYSNTFKANWKDLLNIQHEGYHASVLHKKTLAAHFTKEDSLNTGFPESPGLCSLLTVSVPKPSKGGAQKLSNVQNLAMKYGRTSNWVGNDTSSASSKFPGAVNHKHLDRWVFDCYTIFPNLMIFVGSSVLSVMRVWPTSTHETIWEWDWFFDHEASNFGELFNLEHGRLATRNALAEDWKVIEMVHENMRSGAFNGTHIAHQMEATVRLHYEKLLKHVPLEEKE